MVNISPWGSFVWGSKNWGSADASFYCVYDRTITDVEAVKALASEIKSTGIITQEYLDGMKGAVNYIDLNRIETNTQYLSNLLNDNGYTSVIVTPKTNWVVGDLLTLSEINRIRGNIDILIDSFIAFPELIEIVYNNTLDYVQMNAIEFNIYFIKYSFDKIVSGFIYSGEINSGEGD